MAITHLAFCRSTTWHSQQIFQVLDIPHPNASISIRSDHMLSKCLPITSEWCFLASDCSWVNEANYRHDPTRCDEPRVVHCSLRAFTALKTRIRFRDETNSLRENYINHVAATVRTLAVSGIDTCLQLGFRPIFTFASSRPFSEGWFRISDNFSLCLHDANQSSTYFRITCLPFAPTLHGWSARAVFLRSIRWQEEVHHHQYEGNGDIGQLRTWTYPIAIHMTIAAEPMTSYRCVCVGHADTMLLRTSKVALASSLRKQERSNWNFNTICRAISTGVQLLFAVVWPEVTKLQPF